MLSFKLCTILSSMMGSFAPSCLRCESSLCFVYPHCIHYLPDNHLVGVLVIRLSVMVSQCLCLGNPYLLNNDNKAPE